MRKTIEIELVEGKKHGSCSGCALDGSDCSKYNLGFPADVLCGTSKVWQVVPLAAENPDA